MAGVVTIIRDVSKEKEADRIKTELVSMVAHELKSPLTSIDLSRLEAGRTEIHKSPFDLRQLIDKIKETYSGQATKRQIEVTTHIPAELPFAFGDQDLIEQVLLNLFSNAVKYSPDNSKIGLEVKEEDAILTVNVIDNGYGIPKEALPRIFEKFFRVTESEGDDSIDGSGLGLSLAKEIVEQHDGTIKVTSRLGVGSVFSFTLPKAE
ncbi:MAG: HAMP domain-containing histidine kinase [Deltaproteobacteria bacterium]|nr:HAMP domain-containing histidine kinase [Deltaproteobacteria bacterium]